MIKNENSERQKTSNFYQISILIFLAILIIIVLIK